MIGAIYVEREVATHPRSLAILERFPRVPQILVERYGEVFNRRGQSFRLQKRHASLILARKHGELVLPTPPGYGIGAERNYYFSHMLNCPYDCRYCFLQGMYRSAHHVLFVDYEDFARRIGELGEASATTTFFSGYDCDSLAFEAVTGFVAFFLPVFARLPGSVLELRTKSARFAPLLEHEPLDNVVVAASLTPEPLSRALEHRVPPLATRLRALRGIADRGWRIGLRFDPLLYVENHRELYRGLLDAVLSNLDPLQIHSVSLGAFRLPTGFFRTLERLYPSEPLFAGPLAARGGMVSYAAELESELVEGVLADLRERLPAEILFPCAVPRPT